MYREHSLRLCSRCLHLRQNGKRCCDGDTRLAIGSINVNSRVISCCSASFGV
jgi:hypothetical protein